jgi:hypothetical protein
MDRREQRQLVTNSTTRASTPASVTVKNPTDTGVENRRGPALPGLKYKTPLCHWIAG